MPIDPSVQLNIILVENARGKIRDTLGCLN